MLRQLLKGQTKRWNVSRETFHQNAGKGGSKKGRAKFSWDGKETHEQKKRLVPSREELMSALGSFWDAYGQQDSVVGLLPAALGVDTRPLHHGEPFGYRVEEEAHVLNE